MAESKQDTLTRNSPTSRPYVVLAICCMSMFIVGLDSTIVNVALPAMSRDLHASVSWLQWIVDAYQLVLGAFLILSGSAADRFGRKKVFHIGLVGFSFASLLCSLAPGIGWLIGFRVIQALAAAMLNPVALAIITGVFTDRVQRARAFGVWGSVFGLSLACGPALGGVLVDYTGWRSLFWINVPLGIATVAFSARYVPESRSVTSRRFDPIGQLLLTVCLATLLTGIIEGPEYGWGSSPIIVAFMVAIVSFAGLISYESRQTEPLIDTRFFHSAPFTGSVILVSLINAAFAGFLFLNTLYLQGARHFSPTHAGLLTLPLAAMILVLAPLAGRLTTRCGARIPLLIVGVATVISGLLLTTLTKTTPTPLLLLSYSIFGIGYAMNSAPINTRVVAHIPLTQVGVASAIASTARQFGQAIGVAVVGSAVATALRGPLTESLPMVGHAGWWIIIGMGIAIVLLALTSTTSWADQSAVRTAELLLSNSRDKPALRL